MRSRVEDAMAGGTEVWIGDLGTCGPHLVETAHAQRLLTDDETRRAAAIADTHDRLRWIAAHAALHLTLRHRVGSPVRFMPVDRRAIAKPRVAGWNGDFSLAHSGDLVLIAIADRGYIGIDVEVRRMAQIDGRRRRLIEAAGDAVGGAAAPRETDPQMHFLAAWTRLEAIAKARGCGIGAVLEAVGLRAHDASVASVSDAVRGLLADGAQPLAVRDLDVARFDAVAALAGSPDTGPPAIRELARELSRLAG